MADLAQAPGAGEGTTSAPAPATSAAAPATEPTGSGTATASQATGPAATGQAPEETFFDPANLPPELQGRYKQMQTAFSQKTAALSERAKKYQALEQFAPVIEQYQRDPVTVVQQLAAQHGLILTRAQAAAAAGQGQAARWDPQSGENPPDWGTVLSTAEERAEARLLQKLAPIIGNVQQMTMQNIQAKLDGIDPEWRTHEAEFTENLRQFPGLIGSPEKLYRLSVPMEVIEARATNAALSKLQKRTDAAKASGTSTVNKAAPARPEKMTFEQAAEWAKEQVNKGR